MENVSLYGVDLFGEIIKPQASGVVAQRFTLPPFTILDARQGEWQERKRAWKLLGIESEVGRSTKSTGIIKLNLSVSTSRRC
jgi:hypothetical protein